MKTTLQNLTLGALMGAIISIALFAPMLVSVERAAPNRFNVLFGEYGYHFAMGAAQ
jgi:hypothetical protein